MGTPNATEDVEAIEHGHVDVGDDEIEIGWREAAFVMRRDGHQHASAVFRFDDVEADFPKHARHRAASAGLVLCHEHALTVDGRTGRSLGSWSLAALGENVSL